MQELLFHQSQKEVATDLHRFRVLCCGRRWGKTTLAIDQMKGRATIPNSRIAYIAPTYQQARDIAWEPLKKDLQNAGKINETRLEISLVNGSLLVLRGWESIETLRGQKFDMIVLDEVAMMRNFWLNWQEVIRPTLTDTKGEALFISTPKGFNHFYDLFNLQEKDTDFKSFHFTTYDNPFIPSEEVDKARQQLTEDRFAQEYLADFRKTEGLVYKGFDRKRHVYTDEDIKKRPYVTVERLAGIDWGWTNPAASHSIDKDTDRHYWINNEFYKTQQSTSQIIEWVRSLKPSKVYPDPAEPDRNEEAKKAGLNVREVSKDIEAGISCLQELFKQDRIHIHASCVNLIWELETYSYPEKKPDHNENEQPIKENDHALDEIRYVLYMQESSPSFKPATFYPQSAQPNPQTNSLPPELRGKTWETGDTVPKVIPRVAHTYIPKL